MPQQVESQRCDYACIDINDNENKQISKQQQQQQQSNSSSVSMMLCEGTATTAQLRGKQRSNKQQVSSTEHIYENLRPAAVDSSKQRRLLRKYFQHEAIYENLCRGCGYGVFAAQGIYCHFCQCIVNGVVTVSQQAYTPVPVPTPTSVDSQSASESNIYENICEQCRGIYSEEQACSCSAAKSTPVANTPSESCQPATTTTTTTAAAATTGSSATLTRRSLFHGLFDSLKQLNRSVGSNSRSSSTVSLQRRKRLFLRGSGKSSPGGSLEIIHNVDELFRTQETFDLQRICELKRSQTSCSDQHIYGRLKRGLGSAEPLEQQPKAQPKELLLTKQQLAPSSSGKKPRISRMRLLRGSSSSSTKLDVDIDNAAAASVALPAALYLNESICQWMSMLRQELHSYGDVNSLALCQQPKSVPPAHEQRQQQQQSQRVPQPLVLCDSETVTLRRETAHEQRLVNDFKRKLLAKAKHQASNNMSSSSGSNSSTSSSSSDNESAATRRRCRINERKDSAFVCEFLNAFDGMLQRNKLNELQQSPQSQQQPQVTCLSPLPTATAGNMSLLKLAPSLQLSADFAYDKSLSAILQDLQQQHPQQRCLEILSSSHSETVTAHEQRLFKKLLPKTQQYSSSCDVDCSISSSIHESDAFRHKLLNVQLNEVTMHPQQQQVATATLPWLAGNITLFGLLENAAMAAGLHLSIVVCYNKSLRAFLHAKQQRRQQRCRQRRVQQCSLLARRESANIGSHESDDATAAVVVVVAMSRSSLLLPATRSVLVATRACYDADNDGNAALELLDKTAATTTTKATKTEAERGGLTASMAAASTTTIAAETTIEGSSQATAAAAAAQVVVVVNAVPPADMTIDNQQQQQQQPLSQPQIKVKRAAPQVPVRDPTTMLSAVAAMERCSNRSRNSGVSRQAPLLKSKRPDMNQAVESNNNQQINNNNANNVADDDDNVDDDDDDDDHDDDHADHEEVATERAVDKTQEAEEEEESIYQPIWQFKTLGGELEYELQYDDTCSLQADDDDDDDDDDDEEEEAVEDAVVDVDNELATAKANSPLPSPTISTDQCAWETDDEFMFATQRQEEEEEQQLAQPQLLQQLQPALTMSADTLSLGSTVTNSTATLGSISSRGSQLSEYSLTHPVLRNVCIIYSLVEPKKYRVIFYDYQRPHFYRHFMTRIRRAAPPPPTAAPPASTAPSAPPPSPPALLKSVGSSANNDDSGCSCEAVSLEEELEQPGESSRIDVDIPPTMREAWELAVLAAGSSKRAGAQRAGRKLRVRSNARRLVPSSVLAWRELLQDVNYCEDEEDMVVPVTDILRAQQIKEDDVFEQTLQKPLLQCFKSASIGNLLENPGEDSKRSLAERVRMKLANTNVFRPNASPKSDKKSRRRAQASSMYLEEPAKYPLFSAALNAVELNMTDHPNVPRFVVDVCAYIERPDCVEQDGIYRASGNKLLVDELKRKLTQVYEPRLLQTDDIHTATSLHKQFFRELATPLITEEAYHRLGLTLQDDAAIERMKLAFDEMPEPNRSTLRFLIKHLTNVAAASSSNRMPASNLAIVWGPCLLAANQIQFDIGRMNMLAKVLIENYDRIFRPDNERYVC